MDRIFLLSPARATGRRAGSLTNPDANFELARRLQIGDVTLGEVYAFCSGLYFRGKLTYAQRFASAAEESVFVITPSRGLVSPATSVNAAAIREYSLVDVDASDSRFTGPLQDAARKLLKDRTDEVVLLGSIATDKYVAPLLPIFGDRLLFPKEFLGRGDTSRGALLLRRAASGEELEYEKVGSLAWAAAKTIRA